MVHKTSRLDWIDRSLIALVLSAFGGSVLHAPLIVGFGTLWPDYSLGIKAWEEILMGVALVPLAIVLTRRQRWSLFSSLLFGLIAAYVLLHLLLIPVFFTGASATMAGLLIDLRFFLMFGLMYAVGMLYPLQHRLILWVGGIGAAIVVGFAVLQVTVLPADVLAPLGYNESTIMPYLTVDQNPEYIRINSTLRGPNPLGIYAAIVLAAVVAWVATRWRGAHARERVAAGLYGTASLVALWFSYSRSAVLAMVAAVGLIAFAAWGRKLSRWAWIGLFVGMLAVAGVTFSLKDTDFVSHVILHEDPDEGNNVNSNDGHAESLREGFSLMLEQPLGAGIGSTGSASLMTDEPRIIENQYFFIAHEVGWFGLALFLAIWAMVQRELWLRRWHWLALALFASGVGIAIAGLFLPVWVDDTVAIIWWGLAGFCLTIRKKL